MRAIVGLALAGSLVWLTGCGPTVVDDGSAGTGGGGAAGSDSAAGGNGAGGGGSQPYPTPCHFLRGTATLTSWQGNQDDGSYNTSAFSFEFATHDKDATHNDYDVLYGANTFGVNTVVDDTSFIIDLGDVPLEAAPATVDPAGYPTGPSGVHDNVQAIVNHTYWVRTLDSDTRQVAVFRVALIAPGEKATIDWMRSLDPDSFKAPVDCP